MGRGRQKAKHTKLARELKYFSPDTDLTKLESELGGNPRLDEDLAKWPEYADTATPSDSDTTAANAAAGGPTSGVDNADEAQSA